MEADLSAFDEVEYRISCYAQFLLIYRDIQVLISSRNLLWDDLRKQVECFDSLLHQLRMLVGRLV